MKPTIQVDITQVTKYLQGLGRQAPFALSKGVNDSIRTAQREMQASVPKNFTLRSPNTARLFSRAVKATFTTKQNLTGDIRIEGPETALGPDRRINQMLLRHETGGQHTNQTLYRVGQSMAPLGFFLPEKGLRTAGGAIPRKLYPVNIGVQGRRDPSGATIFANSSRGRLRQRGQQGRELSYFANENGVFERRHFGRFSAIRKIWSFSKNIRLRPRLHFVDTVQASLLKTLEPDVQRAVELAIRTAYASR